jgi:TonB-like protein
MNRLRPLGESVLSIRVRVVVFFCIALACSRPPGPEVSNKEVSNKPNVQTEAAQPLAQPTEPSKPMKVGGEVSAPKPISRPGPLWPHDPNQCYELGTAIFEGVVDRNGNWRDLKLIKGPDNQFTRAARETIAQRTFEPAIYRGKPVDVVLHVSINHVPVKKVKGPC